MKKNARKSLCLLVLIPLLILTGCAASQDSDALGALLDELHGLQTRITELSDALTALTEARAAAAERAASQEPAVEEDASGEPSADAAETASGEPSADEKPGDKDAETASGSDANKETASGTDAKPAATPAVTAGTSSVAAGTITVTPSPAPSGGTESTPAPSGGTEATPAPTETPIGADDLAYVRDKGVLVVGITAFKPMDYQDEDGEWIGFDADMARAFAESLGVKVEFVEIDRADRLTELEEKSVDCIWNGLALTEEIRAVMECSDAYCSSDQVVIVPQEVADDFRTVESLDGLLFAVEADSAGQTELEALGNEFNQVTTQAEAVTEVANGTAETAVVDSLVAAAMVGEDAEYEDLTYTVVLRSDECGVGFRQGSDLAAALNDFFDAAFADGSMQAAAETYGIEDALLLPDAQEDGETPEPAAQNAD